MSHNPYPLLVGTTWRRTCKCHWMHVITEPAEVLRLIGQERRAS